ncbi:MAG: oligosaccharide flippase family protein [Paludibacteraceae bacterium]|nr:oligosaccharide flippase family protein [Paludibacteraceae bacterium]
MDRLRSLFSGGVLKNVASLTLMQVANALIPLLVVPFVVRALGVEAFGKVSYAQNIVAYFTLFVNYGFEYSATQDIALCRQDPERVRVVFWSVLKSKALFLLGAFVVFLALMSLFPKMGEEPILYLFAFLINVGMAITPTWLFQGMETMGKVALVNVTMKALSAVLTILLVVAPSDYCLYILFLSLSYCLAGIALFIMAYVKYGLKYTSEFDFAPLKKGFPIFLNNVFSNMYALGGITLIGILLTDVEIGIYAGGHKIVAAMSMLLSMPLSMALFPSLSLEFASSVVSGWQKLKAYLALILVAGSLFTLAVYFMSPIIVRLFLGEAFGEVVPLLQYLSPIPMLVVIATMFTVQGLYGMQLQRYAPWVGAAILCLSLTLYYILIPICGVYGAALGYVASEILEISIVYSLLRFHLRNL